MKIDLTKAEAFYAVMGASLLADKARLDGANVIEEKALKLTAKLIDALNGQACEGCESCNRIGGQNWRNN
jgi:hypothetical protein